MKKNFIYISFLGNISEEVLISISLPEDINIRGLTGFQTVHSKLNWYYLRTRILDPKQQVNSSYF